MHYGYGPVGIISRQTRSGDTARAATSGALKKLRREASAIKELVADLKLENRLLKKFGRECGERGMKYPAPEKAEFIQLVEQPDKPGN
jgi:transposase